MQSLVDKVDRQLQTLNRSVAELKSTRSSQLQKQIDAIAALGLPGDGDLHPDEPLTLVAVGGDSASGSSPPEIEELLAGS